ncbi:hypothetical protein [Lactobacillus johnsonii]|jgi:hypothetical protein|uniref:Uncharacterized protein n=1 Tax=Lactobacillus johnsonii TaxID=33959 RepID=A0A9X7XVM4_LACJH|nr:hypothetical protein [Lactobacillus johnsonii]QIA88683.1 hypothetical protein FEE39_10600 [Lactobacillus johnsonii]
MYLVREEPVQEKLDALKARDNHALAKKVDWTKVGVYKIMKDIGVQKLNGQGKPMILIADPALVRFELENKTYKFVINRKGQKLSLTDLKGATDGKS